MITSISTRARAARGLRWKAGMRGAALLLVLGLGCGRSWVNVFEAAPPAGGSATSAGSSATSAGSSATSAASGSAPRRTSSPSAGTSNVAVTSASSSTTGSSTSTGGSTSSGSSTSGYCQPVLCDSPPDCSYAIVSIDGGCPACVITCGTSQFDGVWLGSATMNVNGLTWNAAGESWQGPAPDMETVAQNDDGVLEFQYLDYYLVGCTLPWEPAGALAGSDIAYPTNGGSCQDWLGETWSFTSGQASLDATGCYLTEQLSGVITAPSSGNPGSFQTTSTLERLSCFDAGYDDGGLGSPCIRGFADAGLLCSPGLLCIGGTADPYPGTCVLPSSWDPCLPEVGCVEGETCTDAGLLSACGVTCAVSSGEPACGLLGCNGTPLGVCTAPGDDGGVFTGWCCPVGYDSFFSPWPPNAPVHWGPVMCMLGRSSC